MFNETSLPEKEEFYCNFTIDDITDTDLYAKAISKDFEIIKYMSIMICIVQMMHYC